MSYTDVKNKKGTAGNPPPAGCTCWLEFWEKQKGTTATVCEVRNCRGGPDLGGHVIKSGQGSKEYILPMCSTCNNKPEHEIFEAWDTDLVSVT